MTFQNDIQDLIHQMTKQLSVYFGLNIQGQYIKLNEFHPFEKIVKIILKHHDGQTTKVGELFPFSIIADQVFDKLNQKEIIKLVQILGKNPNYFAPFLIQKIQKYKFQNCDDQLALFPQFLNRFKILKCSTADIQIEANLSAQICDQKLIDTILQQKEKYKNRSFLKYVTLYTKNFDKLDQYIKFWINNMETQQDFIYVSILCILQKHKLKVQDFQLNSQHGEQSFIPQFKDFLYSDDFGQFYNLVEINQKTQKILYDPILKLQENQYQNIYSWKLKADGTSENKNVKIQWLQLYQKLELIDQLVFRNNFLDQNKSDNYKMMFYIYQYYGSLYSLPQQNQYLQEQIRAVQNSQRAMEKFYKNYSDKSKFDFHMEFSMMLTFYMNINKEYCTLVTKKVCSKTKFKMDILLQDFNILIQYIQDDQTHLSRKNDKYEQNNIDNIILLEGLMFQTCGLYKVYYITESQFKYFQKDLNAQKKFFDQIFKNKSIKK